MQKKILIPLVLIFAVSGVALGINFSNPNYLPDTVDFPRIPMGSGTIGEVIGKILGTNDLGNYTSNGGTGVVQNTQMLSGTTASGFLKINNCTSNTEVWNGFDSNGKAICATKSTILAYYGHISEQTGTAKIYRLGAATPINANIGTPLNAGDIIKTDGSSSLTIAFIDTSILRLDENTTASLDISTIGTEPNKQIASLILESGQVWGRILSPGTPTSTGYSLGTGDVVAGVRGTSIAIFKGPGITSVPIWDGPQNKWIITPIPASTDIAVVHSRLPANITTGVAILTMKDGTKKIMNPGEKVQYNTTAGTLNTLVSPSSTSIANFYANTIWIRDNTKKDLDYMKTLSGTAIPTTIGLTNRYLLISEVLPTELLTSTPQDDGEKNALCDNNNTQKTYWNTLSGTTYDKCRSERELAFADFTTNINPLIFSGTSISFTPYSLSSTTKIGRYTNITLKGKYKLCATYTGGIAGQKIAGFSGSIWTGQINASPSAASSTTSCATTLLLNGQYNLHVGGNSTFAQGFTGSLFSIEIQYEP